MLADQHPTAHDVQRQVAQGDPAQPDLVAVGEPPQPVGDGDRLFGDAGHDRGEPPGLHHQAALAVDQGTPAGGSSAEVPETSSGSRASTCTTRRAPTRARVNLSAASVTVRTGRTRKAA